MDTAITATATLRSWDETPTPDADAPVPRLATAEVAFAYEGDLTGTSTCHYVLRYGPDGSGDAVGYETITGTCEGEDATLTVAHSCRFDGGGVVDDIVAVDGTGPMAEVRGAGSFQVGHGGTGWSWSVGRA